MQVNAERKGCPQGQATMSNIQRQEVPRPIPVGGQILILDNVFEVAAHTADKNGRTIEVPGKCLGKATTQPSAVARTTAAPRPCGRRRRTARGDYRRFQHKPPPLVIHEEPASLSVWMIRLVIVALVVAGLWLWNLGAEQRKWES